MWNSTYHYLSKIWAINIHLLERSLLFFIPFTFPPPVERCAALLLIQWHNMVFDVTNMCCVSFTNQLIVIKKVECDLIACLISSFSESIREEPKAFIQGKHVDSS